jgi:hypothetical protein
MIDTGPLAPYAPANEAERTTLAERWAHGELRLHMERLLAFVERNRLEVVRLAKGVRDREVLLAACKRLIVEAGTVHHPSEMRDQMRAIEDEIWIRGERGEYDRVHIAYEWTSRHAASWRQWRLKEYCFVADRCLTEIEERLAP